MNKLVLVALLFLVGSTAFAEVRFPLSSFRSQGTGNDFNYHCWAYAAATMLEARSEYVTGVSTTIDVEKDLMYWVFYDRYMARYKAKKPLGGGLDDDTLLIEMGFPTEFFKIFFTKGYYIRNSVRTNGVPNWNFPNQAPLEGPYLSYVRADGKELDAKKLLKLVLAAPTEQEADKILRAELDASVYRLTDTQKVDISATMFGVESNRLAQDPLVYIFITPPDSKELHKWDGDYGGLEYNATAEEVVMIGKKSMDMGWPILQIDQSHVWSVIGYDGNSYAQADTLSGFVFNRTPPDKLHIAVLKSVLLQALPQAAESGKVKQSARRLFMVQ